MDIRADDIYFHVRIEKGKQCMLLPIGPIFEDEKELIGCIGTYRESA